MYLIAINCKITYKFYISHLIVHLVCFLLSTIDFYKLKCTIEYDMIIHEY